MLLTDSYTELGESKQEAKYTRLYAKLNDSLNQAAKKEVGNEFDRQIADVKEEKDKKHTNNLIVIIIVGGSVALLLALGLWLYWKRKNRIIHKKYETLIAKIKEEKEQSLTKKPSQDHKKPIDETLLKDIVDETAEKLLLKIEKFEKSETYLKNEVSLTWLAYKFNTNTRYLSTIIKAHKNKTFSKYINGLRIDYIVRKLVDDPVYREYKISYLAKECGYSSSQVFVIAFKKEIGFTPSYFIENLKKDE